MNRLHTVASLAWHCFLGVFLGLICLILLKNLVLIPDHTTALQVRLRTAHAAVERALIVLDENRLLDEHMEWVLSGRHTPE